MYALKKLALFVMLLFISLVSLTPSSSVLTQPAQAQTAVWTPLASDTTKELRSVSLTESWKAHRPNVEAATTSAKQVQYSGNWQGMTEQMLPFRFTVDDTGMVTNLLVDVRFSIFNRTCIYTLRGQSAVPINNGQFEVQLLSPSTQLAFESAAPPVVRGTFNSATSCSGTVSESRVSLIVCGGQLIFGPQSVAATSWSAERAQPIACPIVSSISPNTGTVGANVTVTGMNLANVTAVKFTNNVTAAFTISSDTQITTRVPMGATSGPLNLSKTGCNDTQTGAFTVQMPLPVTTLSAASFTGPELTAESIAAGFGQGMATATESATSTPLPTTLAGTSVKVKDSAGTEGLAPLFFVSPGQINYLIPPGTANGAANITVVRGETIIATGTAQIATVAPGLFAANANGQGVAAAVALRVKADGTQTFEPAVRFDSATNRFVPVPIDPGSATDRVFLILFGTGFRQRSALSAVTALIGGTNAEVSFVGAQGDLAGLDQANVLLPRSLAGRGEISMVLIVDGKTTNNVRLSIGGTGVSAAPTISNVTINTPSFNSSGATLSGRLSFTDPDGDIVFNGNVNNSAKLRFGVQISPFSSCTLNGTGVFLDLRGQTSGTIDFSFTYGFNNALFIPVDVEVQLLDLAGNASNTIVATNVGRWFCEVREPTAPLLLSFTPPPPIKAIWPRHRDRFG